MATRILGAVTAALIIFLAGTGVLAAPGDILATYHDPEGGQDDEFGYAVAALDGLAIIAAPAKPGGGAVFVFGPDTTSPMGALALPADYVPGRLGHALATTGGLLLVADPEALNPGGGKGAVLLYKSVSDTRPVVIRNPENLADDGFATAIAVGPNGLFAVGAPRYPIEEPTWYYSGVFGRAYIYSAFTSPPVPLYTLSNPAERSREPVFFAWRMFFSDRDHLAVVLGREYASAYHSRIYVASSGNFLRIGYGYLAESNFNGNLVGIYRQVQGFSWWWRHFLGCFDWDTGTHLSSVELIGGNSIHFDYSISVGPGFMFVGAPPKNYNYNIDPSRLYSVELGDVTTRTVLHEQNGTDFGFSTAAWHGDALVGAPARILDEADGHVRAFPAVYLIEGPLVLPQSPTGLLAELNENREVRLTFRDNSYNEDGFLLQRRIGEFSYHTIATLPPDVTEWTDVLTSFVGGRCEYRVQAYNAAGSSRFASGSVDVGPSAHAPTNLQAEQLTPTSVQLTFQDNSTLESGFRIKRTDSASSNTIVESLPPNITWFVDVNAVPERTYCYSVAAFTNEGETDWSPLECITTLPLAGVDLTGSLTALQECEPRRDRIRCKLQGSVIVRNRGAKTARPTVQRIYLSEDTILDGEDEQLKQVRIPKIRPGEDAVKRLKIKRKTSLSGQYLILQVDSKAKLDERDETNNEFVLGPLS